MSTEAVAVFALGVSKESVGKMVKASKTRVIWRIAFDGEFIPHTVELHHSLVSGKVDIALDSVSVYQTKSFSGKFEHLAVIGQQHLVRITIQDTFDGFIYDLVCNGVHFAKMPKKTMQELDALKAPLSLDFSSFTGKSSKMLDGSGAAATATAAVKKEESFNPFDGMEDFPAANNSNAGEDPFASMGSLAQALPPSPSRQKQQQLEVVEDHLIGFDDAAMASYREFNIISAAKGERVELVAGDLQKGLPDPFQDYVQVKTSSGQTGKIAKVALKPVA